MRSAAPTRRFRIALVVALVLGAVMALSASAVSSVPADPGVGFATVQPRNAPYLGSPGRVNGSAVGIAAHGGDGYWVVGTDGGVFSFGSAGFHGSTGNLHLNRPVVGMAATPSGAGYWLVAADGGVFAFGDAGFHGSTGGLLLNRPVVGMAASPSGHGYWLVASDGGIFAFGDAGFHGSLGAIALSQPVVAMAATPTGNGYWMVASDGGVFAFGGAGFYGATANRAARPVVALLPSASGAGYSLVDRAGEPRSFGDAAAFLLAGQDQQVPTVAATRATGTYDGFWTLLASPASATTCVTDPATDADNAAPAVADVLTVCGRVGTGAFTLDLGMRAGRTHNDLLTLVRNQDQPGSTGQVSLTVFVRDGHDDVLGRLHLRADGAGFYLTFDDNRGGLGPRLPATVTVNGTHIAIATPVAGLRLRDGLLRFSLFLYSEEPSGRFFDDPVPNGQNTPQMTSSLPLLAA